MGLFKRAGALGVAKLVYDQARKPENQARIKRAVDNVKARRDLRPPR
ncbi:hypothetical protein [Aeromicrobium sp.]|nr:hypothetical protein [Aeromicrobium sp.]MCK5890489.1 hypothetical protein [Aeromicrobium sp.]